MPVVSGDEVRRCASHEAPVTRCRVGRRLVGPPAPIVWFWKAAFVRPAVLTGNASREKCVFGVVLSGGDFTPGGAYPGNYGYPPNASIDYYASKGMGIVRLPFLWERVQPARNGPLDATEMSRIDPVVDYAISRGLKVGIDVHNGGYGYGALIGGP